MSMKCEDPWLNRRSTCLGKLRKAVPILALNKQCCNLLDAAEVFDLEILDINRSLEVLLDKEKELDQFLRVQKTRIEQVGFNRRYLDMHPRKQLGHACLRAFKFSVCHIDIDHELTRRSPGRKKPAARTYAPLTCNLLARTHSS